VPRHTVRVITGLEIGNFKAFGEPQRVPIKPLTLIFGANSSGKSSIIHSLLLANHAAKTGSWDVREPRLSSRTVDLGGFPHYVHRQQRDAAFNLHYELSLPPTEIGKWLLGKSEEELAPFKQLKSYGLTIEVARRRGLQDPPDQEPELKIQAVEIHLSGQRCLRFERAKGEVFRCRVLAGPDSFVETLLKSILVFSAEHSRRRNLVSSDVQRLEPAALESAFKVLQATFSQVMAERNFLLRRGFASHPDLYWLGESADRYDLPSDSDFTDEQREITDGTVIGLCQNWYEKDLVAWQTGTNPRLQSFEDLLKLSDAPASAAPPRPDLEAEAQAVRINLCQLLQLLTLRASAALGNICYIGPLRQVPELHPTPPHSEAAERTEPWSRVCGDAEARETVNMWLGAGRLGTSYTLKVRRWASNDPEPEERLDPLFEDASSGLQLTPYDLGFGVSQVLPILVEAAAQKHRLIAIEQPELHLHPAQQAELGDVFIESALGERKNTFLLETHSEHLILRILRRVRETSENRLPAGATPVRPEAITVVFVEPTAKGSVVRNLPVTPDGDFAEPWPGGFFAERLADLP
jgi:AAA ATPase domain